MTATVVLCAALAGAAVLILGSSRSELARARLLALSRTATDPERPSTTSPVGRVTTRRLFGSLVVAVVLGLAALPGIDPVVVVCSVLATGAVGWFARERGVAAARREKAAVAAALPTAADLLAMCLSSGASTAAALETVAAATAGPLADRLRRVAGSLRLGAGPDEAWAVEAGDPLARLARSFIRSTATGAPIADAMTAVADEQRGAARWAAEAAARRAGVLAVGPLAVCFLPAFVLTGVVPVILAVAGDVLDGLR